jgi:hypothetical protein
VCLMCLQGWCSQTCCCRVRPQQPHHKCPATRSCHTYCYSNRIRMNVVCHVCAGMVLTDLLLQGAPPAARRFFNALAEEPDTVAAVLVPQIRGIQVGTDAQNVRERRKHGHMCAQRCCLGCLGGCQGYGLVVGVCQQYRGYRRAQLRRVCVANCCPGQLLCSCQGYGAYRWAQLRKMRERVRKHAVMCVEG